MAGRLVILDRDGVINHDSHEYIKSPDEFVPIDGSIAARLSRAGFAVAVATNQSGIARKFLDRPTLEAIHNKLRSAVKGSGAVTSAGSCTARTIPMTVATAASRSPVFCWPSAGNTVFPCPACHSSVTHCGISTLQRRRVLVRCWCSRVLVRRRGINLSTRIERLRLSRTLRNLPIVSSRR